MSSTLPAMSQDAMPRSGSLGLAMVAQVAARLAAAAHPEDAVLDVLNLLLRGLEAEECGVWLSTPAGLIRSWGVGDFGKGGFADC